MNQVESTGYVTCVTTIRTSPPPKQFGKSCVNTSFTSKN